MSIFRIEFILEQNPYPQSNTGPFRVGNRGLLPHQALDFLVGVHICPSISGTLNCRSDMDLQHKYSSIFAIFLDSIEYGK